MESESSAWHRAIPGPIMIISASDSEPDRDSEPGARRRRWHTGPAGYSACGGAAGRGTVTPLASAYLRGCSVVLSVTVSRLRVGESGSESPAADGTVL